MSPTRKRICLLGSTGSVGCTTLRVIADYPERFEVVGLSAQTSAEALAAQVAELKPRAACLSGAPSPPAANGATRWTSGAEGLLELIDLCEPDLVVVAIVGAAGLRPTLKAIDSGHAIALANKETLVTAGSIVMEAARRRGVDILPIDSEHNAIAQCLQGRGETPVRRIILTASGGPFRGFSREQLAEVTVDQALRHPTWSMGPKITIDSATLMNKGFEAIEGHHLFGLDVDKFQVVIHPQSTVHSIVEFHDGSMLAQLGVTDMYFPIANVLAYPERLENTRFDPLDLTALGRLDFEPVDAEAFPCPGYAYEAARRGGTYPAALNAANEVAVQRFLDGEIRFAQIAESIEAVLEAHHSTDRPDLEAVHAADASARECAAALGFSPIR